MMWRLQDLPVIFCMDRAGLSANDGPTHHGLFDIAYLRCVPNVIAMAPKDEDELVDMMFTATHQKHPTFIRYPRGAAEGVPIKEQPKLLEIGKAEVMQNFSQQRRAQGRVVRPGQHAVDGAQSRGATRPRKVSIAPSSIRASPNRSMPGRTEFFGRAADVVVTLEDHVLTGGYGSSVLELFSEKRITTPVVRIGWPDQFIEHASTVDYLREKYGLTVTAIIEKVKAEFGSPGIERPALESVPA